MTDILGLYYNGNYTVTIFPDGTKIRMNSEDTFVPEKPESIDLKITNQCDAGCPYCHEDSAPDGEHADLNDLSFLDTLLPYTELAIGGGNPLSHPGLVDFLYRLKERKLIANMTVNQWHFMNDQPQRLLRWLTDNKLIYGLGISVNYADDRLIQFNRLIETAQVYPNAVIHVINGVISMNALRAMYGKGLKLLILGYKDFRRGAKFHSKLVDVRKQLVYDALPDIMSQFKVVSFDNLAVEQLEVKRLVSEERWRESYMGNDGQFTMYIDAVKREFAKSSTSTNRRKLLDDIAPMFQAVRGESQSG